jgi:hypothetical protein
VVPDKDLRCWIPFLETRGRSFATIYFPLYVSSPLSSE